jgi:hypothetical protein
LTFRSWCSSTIKPIKKPAAPKKAKQSLVFGEAKKPPAPKPEKAKKPKEKPPKETVVPPQPVKVEDTCVVTAVQPSQPPPPPPVPKPRGRGRPSKAVVGASAEVVPPTVGEPRPQPAVPRATAPVKKEKVVKKKPDVVGLITETIGSYTVSVNSNFID